MLNSILHYGGDNEDVFHHVIDACEEVLLQSSINDVVLTEEFFQSHCYDLVQELTNC